MLDMRSGQVNVPMAGTFPLRFIYLMLTDGPSFWRGLGLFLLGPTVSVQQ